MLYTEKFALLAIPAVVLGFFIVPVIPIMIEFANEVCYPIGEATITGFLFSVAHVLGFFLGSGFSFIID
jgi:FLVCR family feline leukemia virus subgroup C receptor-related protein